MVPQLPLAELQELEASRRSRVLVYCTAEVLPKGIDADDIHVIYRCLRGMKKTERLDLVLHTGGGKVHAARRIALLLREFTDHLSILVPYRARSAGTLLCLGADELVMGPLGEFSPLDPLLSSAADVSSTAPRGISAEDIRAFHLMAEAWFHMDTPEHKTKVFEVLAQRFFPTALSGFFRADRYVRKVAEELLRHQLPGSSIKQRRKIVDRLIRDYPDHAHSITRSEVAALGLAVNAATDEEELLLWEILQGSLRYLGTGAVHGSAAMQRAAVLFSRQFGARFLRPRVNVTSADAKEMSGEKSFPRGRMTPLGTWEMFSSDCD